MVPGSTLRYGSSFWRETVRWRAFRMFPIDAAVMPLPREETTPPVTKTYFDMDGPPGGFSDFTGASARLNLYRTRVRAAGFARSQHAQRPDERKQAFPLIPLADEGRQGNRALPGCNTCSIRLPKRAAE